VARNGQKKMGHPLCSAQYSCYQVPTVKNFLQHAQINSVVILCLEKALVCHAHKNKLEGPGCCYVDPKTGNHLACNMFSIKAWASFVVS
jgi:hypothetical protein